MFVVAFIGSPSMNLYDGAITVDGDGGSVEIGTQRVALAPESLAKRPALRTHDGQRIVVGIRPEDIEDVAVVANAPSDRQIRATVKLVEALGSELMVHMAIDATTVDSGDLDAPDELPGEGAANLVAASAPRSKVHIDDNVDVVVATENIHFFDAQTRSHLVVMRWAAPVGGSTYRLRPAAISYDIGLRPTQVAVDDDRHRNDAPGMMLLTTTESRITSPVSIAATCPPL